MSNDNEPKLINDNKTDNMGSTYLNKLSNKKRDEIENLRSNL